MKALLKLFIPKHIWFKLKALKAYYYDIDRYIKHSNTFYELNSSNKIIAQIIYRYHVIEKGLTMPERRKAFGAQNVLKLIEDCKLYIQNGYDLHNEHFTHAIQTLLEYKDIHNENEISEEIRKKINSISNKTSIHTPSSQLELSYKEYFKDTHSPFPSFAKSRYSIRNFSSKRVELSLIKNAIAIAQKSPSACNRQPNRVHIIQTKEIISQVLSIHSGNRGFGHLADKLLIVTSDISVFNGIEERNEIFFNSGLFTMSLLFSLHHNKIGACSLNWSVEKTIDIKLRSIVNIPDYESVTMLIVCGHVPENIKIATSPRTEYKKVTTIH